MFWKIKKEGLSSFKTAPSNRKTNIAKKASIAMLLILCLSFNMAFAKEDRQHNVKEIYHIYLEDQYLGALSNKEKMQALLDSKLKESSSQHEALPLKIGTDLSVVPEQVFTPTTNDEATLQKLNEQVEVKTSAFALLVNDEMAVYVRDIEEYQEVIRKVKLNYISEEEYSILEARKNANEDLPKLKEGETRIADLILKQKVSGVTVEVEPNKVMAVDEAVQLLLDGTLKQETYQVQEGDVLGKIASKFNLSISELKEINPGITEDSLLKIGQDINVTVLKPLINVEVYYEKKELEVIPHAKEVIETDDMFKGDKKVKQEGSDGKRLATYLIRKENGVQVGSSTMEEKVLVEPQNRIVLKGTKVIPSRGSGSFAWPAEGGYISSKMGYRWGRKHEGIDIARPSGYNIKAADNGVVVAAGRDGTYGNRVIINHQNGYKTTYAHLSSISVSVGDVVPQGSVIGVMGNTGRSTGIHLHFEVEKNGVTINPLSVLR